MRNGQSPAHQRGFCCGTYFTNAITLVSVSMKPMPAAPIAAVHAAVGEVVVQIDDALIHDVLPDWLREA